MYRLTVGPEWRWCLICVVLNETAFDVPTRFPGVTLWAIPFPTDEELQLVLAPFLQPVVH